MKEERARRLAGVALRVGRGIARRLPARLRRRLDDWVFYAVFNLTRVTNDNYGWRPEDTTAPRGAEDAEDSAGSA